MTKKVMAAKNVDSDGGKKEEIKTLERTMDSRRKGAIRGTKGFQEKRE